MPRIPVEHIERIKREVPIEELVREYGIELEVRGKDLFGHCPWHEDSDPSFSVTPGKNLWNCLAGCGGGDTIQFVMRCEKVSFREAAEKLLSRLGLAPPRLEEIKTYKGTREILALPGEDLSGGRLMGIVADFYHSTFCNQPQAMAYLQKRKCFHPEAVKLFRLGYGNRTLGYRVPTTTLAGRELKLRLQRMGILRESGHEHLSGSIVVPLFNEHGEVVQMYGRKIEKVMREAPKHLYLSGELRGVFNRAALEHQKEILLCESILDALTLWSAGLRNVTTTFGTNNFTPELWELLKKLGPQRIILCFDHDEAGEEAVKKYTPELIKLGAKILRAKLPYGEDINEVARNANNPSYALAACIERAEEIAYSRKEPRLHVAMEVDEMTGEALPFITKEGLETSIGWASSPFIPAPYEEVMAQRREEEAAKKKEPSLQSAPILKPQPSSLVADLLAAPQALPSPNTLQPEMRGEDIFIKLGDREYRIRGLNKNTSYETLKINLRVKLDDEHYHQDNLDMARAKEREHFARTAAGETKLKEDIIKRDLSRLLLKLEELQEENIRRLLAPKGPEIPGMSEEERKEALELLQDPKLLERILRDFDTCGVVGEDTNKLIGYLAALSRKFDKPLGVIIQSTSAAGKTTLMEAVLSFVPEEERVKYSAMTGQALFYLGEADIKNKILAIAEEEGAERATYALKLLQSEGELTIASTGKDSTSGRLVTETYHVEGPVMIFFTTTSIELDEELANRCLTLTVDESREQTRRIHELQREEETIEGYLSKKRAEAVRHTHCNAQRLLQTLPVHNPFAKRLTFPDENTRLRRDQKKYLTLIRAIALLHQHQRPRRTHEGVEHVEVTLSDIEQANRLAGEILGRSLDEMPPQTRRFLDLLLSAVWRSCQEKQIEQPHYRFTQREVRQWTGYSPPQVKRHLAKLVELEYILTHRGGRGQSFLYELLYTGEGRDGVKFLMGLIDPEKLAYDTDQYTENSHRDTPGIPQVHGRDTSGLTHQNGSSPSKQRGLGAIITNHSENRLLGICQNA